jgi:hypothetical protein
VYKFSIANQRDIRPFFIGKKPKVEDEEEEPPPPPPPGHFSEP